MLWARYNVNPGLFVYSLHVAVVHRKDFAGLEMPAIYEIFPHHFFNFDVIQRAQLYKQQGFPGVKKVDDVYTLVLHANYTSQDLYSYDEQKLSYYTEDVGLNSYFFYQHVDYPFWLGGKEFGLYKDRRGEYFFWVQQQMLARYLLERYSHDMPRIKDFTWWTPLQPYYPNMRTYYGYPFMSRDEGHIIHQENVHYEVDYIYAYEHRLLDAIDSGRFKLPNGSYVECSQGNGIDYLGNLVEGNPDSYNQRYYDYFSQVYKVFGRYYEKTHQYQGTVNPSVFSHPELQARDPAYWSFIRRYLLFYFYRYTGHMSPYTEKDIGFDGVQIESVNVDKLITYFDHFDADISNAVDVEYPIQGSNNNNDDGFINLDIPIGSNSQPQSFGRVSQYHGEDFVIKARQQRLNHIPFKVSVKVKSKVATPAVVRFFLGIKHDEVGHVLNLNENRHTFFMLDAFKYDLVEGTNSIIRQSREFFNQVKDRTSYYELYKWMMMVDAGTKQWQMDNSEAHSGFPNRLLLPRGKEGGQVFRLFVHVSPYVPPQVPQYSTFDATISTGIGSGSRYIDNMPLLYPLDRLIDELHWYTPNMHYEDVTIYHKTENEINSSEHQ